MDQHRGVTIEVLAERLKAVQEDVAELRQLRKDDHHRLRGVESSVTLMLDEQKLARAGEARQYRRLGFLVALGGFAVALGMFALTIATIVTHH